MSNKNFGSERGHLEEVRISAPTLNNHYGMSPQGVKGVPYISLPHWTSSHGLTEEGTGFPAQCPLSQRVSVAAAAAAKVRFPPLPLGRVGMAGFLGD